MCDADKIGCCFFFLQYVSAERNRIFNFSIGSNVSGLWLIMRITVLSVLSWREVRWHPIQSINIFATNVWKFFWQSIESYFKKKTKTMHITSVSFVYFTRFEKWYLVHAVMSGYEWVCSAWGGESQQTVPQQACYHIDLLLPVNLLARVLMGKMSSDIGRLATVW